MFEAYITNTALYPLMGIEVGTTVHFPMTTQELQAALAKIGIDGKRYSEVFFTSFDSDVLGLYDYLYECENIDELNELGHALLEVRDKGGLETFEAALVLGNHTRSVKDLINLTQNLDLYRFYPDISDDEGLGRLYADELGTIDIPEHIQNYFDYEAYTRYEPQEVLEDFTEEFHRRYGVECVSALHHNKRKTNYHIHLIFSERKLLPEPDIKRATRSVFYDETVCPSRFRGQ